VVLGMLLGVLGSLGCQVLDGGLVMIMLMVMGA
jgi:hypothetical protein